MHTWFHVQLDQKILKGLTCIALLSDGFSIPNNSWILVSIWDLNVKEHGKAHEHNFPSRSFLQTEQYPAKKVANSVSISDCVVVHPGIWQTKGDSCVNDIIEIWRVFFSCSNLFFWSIWRKILSLAQNNLSNHVMISYDCTKLIY